MVVLAFAAAGAIIGGSLAAAIGASIATGVMIGWLVGSMLAMFLFPSSTKVDGPRLQDLKIQSASYGQPIPWIWGRFRVAGNVIWATDMVEVRETKTKDHVKTRTYFYFGNWATGIAKGPQTSITRIWADGKLIYDAVDGSADSKYVDYLTLYLGTEAQNADPYMESIEGAGNVPGYRGLVYIVFKRFPLADFGNRLPSISVELNGAVARVAISNIVSDICTGCGISGGDIVTTSIAADTVYGFGLTRQSTGRAGLEPLRHVFFFDGIEIDGKLKFVKRGGASAATIGVADMGVRSEATEDQPRLSEVRRQETDMARRLTFGYIDLNQDYDIVTQQEMRITKTGALSEKSIEVPVVMDVADAKKIVQRWMFYEWMARSQFEFTLAIKWVKLDAGDVITVTDIDGGTRQVYVTEVNIGANNLLEVKALHDDNSVWIPSTGAAGAEGGGVPQTVVLPGNTTGLLLDIPLLRDVDDTPGFYVAAYPTTNPSQWPGAVLYVSDDDQEFTPTLTLSTQVTYGTTLTTLGSFITPEAFDYVNTVDVTKINGNPASVTEDDVLDRKNIFMIGDEMLGATTVTSLGFSSYRLSGLLRGLQGTDWAMGSHTSPEPVVLLKSDGSILNNTENLSYMGANRYYKIVTVGKKVEDVASVQFANTNLRLKPLAPVQLEATRDGGSGDWTITWVRRSRFAGDWTDNYDDFLDEPIEAYKVYILDGVNIKRTIDALNTTTVVYTSAQQTADFGSPPNPLSLRVHQLSDRVGLGYGRSGSFAW